MLVGWWIVAAGMLGAPSAWLLHEGDTAGALAGAAIAALALAGAYLVSVYSRA